MSHETMSSAEVDEQTIRPQATTVPPVGAEEEII